MTEFHIVTPDFAVTAQMRPENIAGAAAKGFKMIINNRPDGEAPDQPSAAAMKAAVESAGMDYRTLPFQGQPPPAIVAATAALLGEARGPVLAYCKSGMRSLMAWAMAQALSGARRPDEILAMAAKAGYDLSGARGTLETLAP